MLALAWSGAGPSWAPDIPDPHVAGLTSDVYKVCIDPDGYVVDQSWQDSGLAIACTRDVPWAKPMVVLQAAAQTITLLPGQSRLYRTSAVCGATSAGHYTAAPGADTSAADVSGVDNAFTSAFDVRHVVPDVDCKIRFFPATQGTAASWTQASLCARSAAGPTRSPSERRSHRRPR